MISNKDGYTVLLEHGVPSDSKSDVKEFTVSILYKHEDGGTVLDSKTFEHTSIVVGRKIARRYGEHLMQSDVKLSLWAKALGREMGFEVDFSKGFEYFFDQVASHIDTEHLELYIQGAVFEPFRIVMENELKKREEVKLCMVSKQY